MVCIAPSSRAGFSLVELLIVVTILGIAAAMVVPSLGNTAPTRLRGAAQLLAADLAYAQIESLSHGDDPRVVVFDIDAETYHIAAVSDTATPIANPIGGTPYLVEYGTGRAAHLPDVTIDSVSLDGDTQLGFGIYGQTDQTTDATITLAAGVSRITLTVDPSTGDVTIGDIQ